MAEGNVSAASNGNATGGSLVLRSGSANSNSATATAGSINLQVGNTNGVSNVAGNINIGSQTPNALFGTPGAINIGLSNVPITLFGNSNIQRVRITSIDTVGGNIDFVGVDNGGNLVKANINANWSLPGSIYGDPIFYGNVSYAGGNIQMFANGSANFNTGNININSGALNATSANIGGGNVVIYANGYINTTNEIDYLRTYGSFLNGNDVAITANTVANLDLPTTGSANGISIASNNQITIARAGTYNFQFSLQLTNSDNAADHEFDVWFAKNGTDIADSATTYTVIKNNGKNVAALNFVDTCSANDYYQIRYAATSANISLEAFANITSPYTRPAIPSAIVTVVPVGA